MKRKVPQVEKGDPRDNTRIGFFTYSEIKPSEATLKRLEEKKARIAEFKKKQRLERKNRKLTQKPMKSFLDE